MVKVHELIVPLAKGKSKNTKAKSVRNSSKIAAKTVAGGQGKKQKKTVEKPPLKVIKRKLKQITPPASSDEEENEEDEDFEDESNAEEESAENGGAGNLFESDDEEEEDEDEEAGTSGQSLEGFLAGAEDDDDDDSDDELGDDFDGESDEEEDGGEGDQLPIEKQSKKIEKKEKRDKKLSEKEMKLNLHADGQETYELPEAAELDEAGGGREYEDFHTVQSRVKDIIHVLADFKTRREPQRTRSEYMNILMKDLCHIYGYNEYLMEKFIGLFPADELLEFLEANETSRPDMIRVNTLKTRRKVLAQALIDRGVSLQQLGTWTKVGLKINSSTVPVGATPEYLAGHYIKQSGSSFLPVMALAPKEGEQVLDMCAAPGGKTTYVAALMKNTGVLFANDINERRCKPIIGNLSRLGVQNTIVSSVDGLALPKMHANQMDRVLLDAPCSGTGVIAKDPRVKGARSSQDVQKTHTLQRQLLLAAIDCCNAKSATGGYVVYSTCSVLVEENEAVVNYALRRRHVKLVPIGIDDLGIEGFHKFREYRFHPSLSMTRRIYPHTHNLEGFFTAKLKKLSNEIPTEDFISHAGGPKPKQKRNAADAEDPDDEFNDPSNKKFKKYRKTENGSTPGGGDSVTNDDSTTSKKAVGMHPKRLSAKTSKKSRPAKPTGRFAAASNNRNSNNSRSLSGRAALSTDQQQQSDDNNTGKTAKKASPTKKSKFWKGKESKGLSKKKLLKIKKKKGKK